ncbi:beta-lactamase class A [Kitasatospora sp. MAA4]|uniref:class A beta-lactamase n=1 Tax=Kitasatospora sp. MAA4 TaxID=3035093 RepID=UPI002476221A|nr:class A beta-lactamase [Kitasatospora sp. MAA4]MDH6136837.1 beta-lactamase class A [Kitasatospora sp. MAA4]
MESFAVRPSRRALLAIGAGTALATAVSAGGPAYAATGGVGLARALGALEREHGARLGVFARNTATGRSVLYRADELFPICSVHKTITAAAVLRDLDRDGAFLAKRIRYTAQDVARSGYSPVTGTPEHLANGLTVAQLCAAALDFSDNTADTLLLRELGGPTAITRFCRSIGDRTTRLDRWEPELNSAEPGRVTDTTSPRALARTLTELLLGSALTPPHRRQLTDWMLANTTSAARFRAALPKDWTLADKTGSGDYGTTNDAGIAWTPQRTPLVLTVLSTKTDAAAPADEPLVARTAALLVTALTGQNS